MKTYHIYIDEAGRGPLAGPIYVGLILPLKKLTAKEVSLFKDSKKLSEKQREAHFDLIQQLQKKGKLIAVSAFATVKEIDTYGMTNAEHMAIVRGLKVIASEAFGRNEAIQETGQITTHGIASLCSQGQVHLYIDGKSDFNLHKHYPELEITTIIDGDDKIKEISMASIIAKVSRDRVMHALPKKYLKYAFNQHKGYGTKLHKEKIIQYGPSNIHRKLFLKRLFPNHKVQRKLPETF